MERRSDREITTRVGHGNAGSEFLTTIEFAWERERGRGSVIEG